MTLWLCMLLCALSLFPTALNIQALAASPSWSASLSPSASPSRSPTYSPSSAKPTLSPSVSPRAWPTSAPSRSPTRSPTSARPTNTPSSSKPTDAPSSSRPHTSSPSTSPSRSPSASPLFSKPSASPSSSKPSTSPATTSPSRSPSPSPSSSPSSSKPSFSPTTSAPSGSPSSAVPSISPTSSAPSRSPTSSPTLSPSTSRPSASPASARPSNAPSTSRPSASPTRRPSASPHSSRPSTSPSHAPTTSRPSHSPASAQPSHAPSSSRPTLSPTVLPTTSPTPPTTFTPSIAPSASPTLSLDPVEQAAWGYFAAALKSPQWTACNNSPDPCLTCTPNEPGAAILCDSQRRRRVLRSLQAEHRHVTIISLRALGLVGVVPVDALNAFTQVTTVDLSGNNLTLPDGVLCADVYNCVDPAAQCDMGTVDLCDADGNPQGSTSNPGTFTFTFTAGVIVAVIAGVSIGLGLLFVVSTFLWEWHNSAERLKVRRELRRERRRERKRQAQLRAEGQIPPSPNRLSRLPLAFMGFLPSPPGLGSPPSPRSLAKRFSERIRNIPLTPGLPAGMAVPPPPGPPPGMNAPPPLPPGRRKKSRYQPPQATLNDKDYDVLRPRSTNLRDFRPVDPSLAWTESKDPNTGNIYWVNQITGQFSWTPPTAVAVAGAPGGFGGGASSLPIDRLGSTTGEWEEVFDAPSGQTVWVHPGRGEFSWTKPLIVR